MNQNEAKNNELINEKNAAVNETNYEKRSIPHTISVNNIVINKTFSKEYPNEGSKIDVNDDAQIFLGNSQMENKTEPINTVTTTKKLSSTALHGKSSVNLDCTSKKLHYAVSAPELSSVRTNAQHKIKTYHDAGQKTFWDTKSCTSLGGAILKSGSNNTYGAPKSVHKTSDNSMLPRRVSFPKSDNELVTSYLEPANPWEHVSTVKTVSEIEELYINSCEKHNSKPLPDILEHLKTVELNQVLRQPMLCLKETLLSPGDCEALEEIFKRVQYKCIDLSSCDLVESAVSALFEIIEYYEATNELNILSNPRGMTTRGWSSCAYMVGRSQALQLLNASGNPISKSSAETLGNALCTSNLHILKLEHCGLKGAPLIGLCSKMRHNQVLKELWLAYNDLDCRDAESIADLLKFNNFLELVDISNNNIGDNGLKVIVDALKIQTKELERRSTFQRSKAIEDDIFTPVEQTTIEEKFQNLYPIDALLNSSKLTNLFEPKELSGPLSEESSEVLNVDPDVYRMKTEAMPMEIFLTKDESETKKRTDIAVQPNTKQLACVASGGGLSMLDKLLSMHSDSRSEGVCNVIPSIKAVHDLRGKKVYSGDNTLQEVESRTNGCSNLLTKNSPNSGFIMTCADLNKETTKEIIPCDTCKLEAKIHCNHCDESNKSIETGCNNNNNVVQNQQNSLKKNAQISPDFFNIRNLSDFDVSTEDLESTSDYKSNPEANIVSVDANKNGRSNEDYDDTHSTDSAFESASEGDTSRHLPEEFLRFSTSLESTRLDDMTKDLAIEPATILTESTECLVDSDTTPMLLVTKAQKLEESKTRDNIEVRFAEPLFTESNGNVSRVSLQNNFEKADDVLASKTVCSESVDMLKVFEQNNPAPTPPPPSTSPGGISLSMRRTNSSCDFIAQSMRNHSQSSDSLCSDNSIDGSINGELMQTSLAPLNNHFVKNDTLTRQLRQMANIAAENIIRASNGLKALAVWNNNLTKQSGVYISDLIANTSSLELLNIGKNILSNQFILHIKESLTKNVTLTTLGLQSAHLSTCGIIALAEIVSFGGNCTLQRIDIRDNNLESESITTLCEALKSNTMVTQIDIDDEPKRLSIGSDAYLQYTRALESVRSICARNEKAQALILSEKSENTVDGGKRRGYYVGSRKISLTCHSRPLIDFSVASAVIMPSSMNKLEVKRKSGVRLRSPVPSPPTISPSSSPNRNRFQVCRVTEVSPLTSPLVQSENNSTIPTFLSCSDDQEQVSQPSSGLLTASISMPSMATITSSTQTIKRLPALRCSRFHVSKIYEDPKVPLSKRSLPPITPPIYLPSSPIITFKCDNDLQKEEKSVNNEIFDISELTISETMCDDQTKGVIERRRHLASFPIAVFNENEKTLTHNSANDVLLNTADGAEITGVLNLRNVEPEDKNSELDENLSVSETVPNLAAQGVLRKVSSPTSVDKLLTLFNPIFQRATSPEHKIVEYSVKESENAINQPINCKNTLGNAVASTTKQLPSTWCKIGSEIFTLSTGESEKITAIEQPRSFFNAASRQLRDLGKQVFGQNTSIDCNVKVLKTDKGEDADVYKEDNMSTLPTEKNSDSSDN